MTAGVCKRILVIGCMIFFVASCNLPDVNKKLNDWIKQHDPEARKSLADTSLLHWKYDQQVDRMTSDTTYFAQIQATQKLSFKFPDNHLSVATLYIRYWNGINDIFLLVPKGQFNISAGYNVYFRVRFDTEKPINSRVVLPSDDSKNAVFMLPADTLIAHLKKAKKMLIEADFYNDGEYIIEFDVAGLKWSHNDTKKAKEMREATARAKTNTAPAGKTDNIWDNVFNPKQAHTSIKTHVSVKSYRSSEENGGTETNYEDRMDSVQAYMPGQGGRLVHGGNSTFRVLNTQENIDKDDNTVTLTCTCRNTGSRENTVTLQGTFMDADDRVLAVKTISISCSGNTELTTSLTASGIADSYKKFKVEVK